MGHSEGLRHGTRYLFRRKFRKHGMPAPSHALRTFRIGDIVDIRVNGAVHGGMPHRIYHGRTGLVWNVSPRAVGVLVKRRVNNHIAPKRIYVRTEHVFKSRCKEDFFKRVKDNFEAHKNSKASGTGAKLDLKRQPEQPREGHFCKPSEIRSITSSPFVENW